MKAYPKINYTPRQPALPAFLLALLIPFAPAYATDVIINENETRGRMFGGGVTYNFFIEDGYALTFTNPTPPNDNGGVLRVDADKYFTAQPSGAAGTGRIRFINNVAGTPATGRNGGAIYTTGTLSLTNALIEMTSDFDTASIYTNSGGGLYQGGGSVELADVEFKNLRAVGTYGGGGALLGITKTADAAVLRGNILFDGNTAIVGGGARINWKIKFAADSSVVFSNNTATVAANATNAVSGGAIYLNGGDLDFEGDATFSGNRAYQPNAAATSQAQGGAINNYGGNATDAGGIFFRKKAVFTGNSVATAGTGAGQGGVINVSSYGKSVEFFGDTIFSDNSAETNGGAIISASGQGALNYILLSGSSLFDGNTAGNQGGALHTGGRVLVNNAATFTNNTAGAAGGAIFLNSAGGVELTLGDTAAGDITFSGNIANKGAANETRNAIHFVAYSANSGSLTIDTAAGRSVNFLDGISSDTGGKAVTVTKNGAGSVLFDTYASDIKALTTVNGGTFALANNASYGASSAVAGSTFTLNNGATLLGHGTINAVTTAAAGSAITVGDPAAATPARLAFGGDLTLAGATVRLDLFDTDGSNPGAHDQLVVTGALNATGANTIDVASLKSGAHTFRLISAATLGGAIGENYTLTINGLAPTARYAGSALAIDGNNLELRANVVNLATDWTGANAANPGLWDSGAATNWSAQADANEKYFSDGDSVGFGDTAAQKNITIAPGGVTVASMRVNNTAGNDYTFGGSGGIAARTDASTGLTAPATGKLVKQGAGALNFANTGANTFSGGIELAQGTLAITAASQIDTTGTALTFTGDATLRADADIAALSNKLVAGAGRTATLDTAAHTVTYNGDLSGIDPAATLAKAGAGTLKFAGDYSAFAGTLRIDQGRFLLANNASALAGTLIAANSGAVIGGAGTFSGNIAINAGTLLVGAGTPTDILNITGALAATDKSRITFQLYDNQAAARLNITGAGTLAGIVPGATIVDLDFSGITLEPSGTYTLGAGLAGLDTAAIYLNGVQYETGSRQNASFLTDGGVLKFVYSTEKNRVMTWTGAAGDAIWNSDGSANWIGSEGKTRYLAGDIAVFTGAADTTITIQGVSAKASEVRVDNTGTLTFAGLGISAASTYATGDEVTPALATGKLVKTGPGTLVFNNDANEFTGGIQIGDTGTAGGVIAFNTAAQLGNAITFAGDGTLRPLQDGLALAGRITFGADARGAIDIAQNQSLTLSGVTAGAGTLVKTGGGTLIYSGAGALGHLATSIEQGVVRLTDISTFMPPLHTFILDGGWLDLSDTPYVSDGSTANNWENFTFLAGANTSSGGIIGSNDAITLRDGDNSYDIGSPDNPEKRGVFVRIAAGEGGAATLSGSNHYKGYTRIDSGVLRVSADENLGDKTANREVIINGGTLAIAASFNSTRSLELRKTGGVSVDSGVATTWLGVVKNATGPVTFTKDGAGDFTVTGANQADALHVKGGRYIARSLAALGAGGVTADAGATVEIDVATTGSLSNTFSGEGALTVGKAYLTLSGTNTIGAINATAASSVTAVSTGALGSAATTLTITDASVLLAVDHVRAGHVRMNGNPASAKFGFTPDTTQGYRTATITSLGGAGTILLYSNIALSQANHLTVTDASTGTFNLLVKNTGASPAGDRVEVAIPVVTIASGPATFRLVDDSGAPVDAIDAGMLRYGLRSSEAEASTVYSLAYTGQFSSLGRTINYIAGAMPLTWFSELDALHKRLGDVRFETGGVSGPQLWMRGHAQQFDIDTDVLGAGYTERQYGVTVGLDYANRTASLNTLVGVFAGYGDSQHDVLPRSDAHSTSMYAGGYVTVVGSGGWYADTVLKYNSFDNDFSMSYYSIPVTGDYTNYAIGGSIEGGKRIRLGGAAGKWSLTPQAQLAAAYLSGADYATNTRTRVTVDSGWSLQGRVGGMLAYSHTDSEDAIFQPYVKLYAANQRTSGIRLRADGGSWDPRIDGFRVEAGFGFNWMPTPKSQVYLDYEYAYGETYAKPYGLNLGVRYIW